IAENETLPAEPTSEADATAPSEGPPSQETPPPAAGAEGDPVLQLARLLAEQEGASLFGNPTLTPDEEVLM
ncbi:MAG: hypothetical protein KDD47_04030, partial [Acidobacteria bacterium]|nr:hypothetical protein [Acidobacteriota bacterium]